MIIGAWFDAEENALRLRIRGATRAESRRALAHLARFLQSLDPPRLRVLGGAIQATLEDACGGEDAVPAVAPGAADRGSGWPAPTDDDGPPLIMLFADPDPAMRRFYWDAYSHSRHDVVVTRDPSHFMRRYKALNADLLISGVGSTDADAGANPPQGAAPGRPRPPPGAATAPDQPGTVNHGPAGPRGQDFARREAPIGAWFDPLADELHLRMWEAKNGAFRRTLADLARAVQSIDLPELRAMGQAIEATLAEEGAAAPDDYGAATAGGARTDASVGP